LFKRPTANGQSNANGLELVSEIEFIAAQFVKLIYSPRRRWVPHFLFFIYFFWLGL